MRIKNVVNAQWSEFDLDSATPVWVIPREPMKKTDQRFPAHRVPLAPEIAAELRGWRKIAPKCRFVFPSPTISSRPISRESVEKAYRETLKLAGRHCPHGWRTSFASQARDHGFDRYKAPRSVPLSFHFTGSMRRKVPSRRTTWW